MSEKILETKQCKHCQTSFDITDKDVAFYDKISPVFAGKKYSIPTPTFCPDCRAQRRLSFRNERKLYHRNCDLTGEKIISMYSPDKQVKVYSVKERFGDKRDALQYGITYDPNKPFFQQFGELLKAVPKITLIQVGSENSEYTNHGGFAKNTYLCFDYGWNEDSAYLSRTYKSKNCLDLSYCMECEMSYYLLDCSGCVKSNFCVGSEKCYDCNFCYSCKNCSSCFLCSNLVNKQYHIYDKPYAKADYEEEVKRLKERGAEKLYADFLDVMKKSIHRCNHNLSCENVTGDYLKNCKNCYNTFGAVEAEDSKYLIEGIIISNTYDDCFSGNGGSFNLDMIGCENPTNIKYSFSCRSSCSDLMYCHFCHGCHNCFGCAGLKNKEYCIFNTQYTKAEYEILVPQIIEQMQKTGERGEFFPSSISPFCYNESLGQEFYPLEKEEAVKQGFAWMDTEYAVTVPDGTKLLDAQALPDIQDVADDILQQAIVCEVSGRPFRIIKSELEYYRKNNFPLPKKHPDIRHMERFALRNPRKLFDRKCDKCGIVIKTTYSPERKEIVYCENCYNKEIYG